MRWRRRRREVLTATEFFVVVSGQFRRDGATVAFTYSTTFIVEPHVTELKLYRHAVEEAASENGTFEKDVHVLFYRAAPNGRADHPDHPER